MTRGINDTMLIPVAPAAPRGFFFVACRALNQVEMSGSEMRGSDSDCVCVKKMDSTSVGRCTYDACGTGTPPREGSRDRHHAITDPYEMIRHELKLG